jgi:uncharacterized protein
MAERDTTNRGFARMSADKQREIASKGGRAAHQKGTAHKFTSEEARMAGRKGGQRSRSGHQSPSSHEQPRQEEENEEREVSLEPENQPSPQSDHNE